MPIEAIEPQRLYRQISDQLRTLSVEGEFAVGARLPSERDLALQLGVSRPSLREALIALEVQGYIEVHMGSGIYVRRCAAMTEGEIDLSTEEGPLELIRAREMIEGEVAYAAARNASDAQLEAIAQALAAMVADTDGGINPLQADRLFHIRIAEATGNGVLVRLVTQLFDARLGPLFKRLHSHFDSEVVWRQAIAEHTRVMQALHARDALAAQQAMRQHMDIAFERYSASLTPRQPESEAAGPTARMLPTRKAARARKPAQAAAKAGTARLLSKNKTALAAVKGGQRAAPNRRRP